MKKIISFILFLAISSVVNSQEIAECTKEAGDKAYSESRFDDAIAIYETMIAEQGASLPLYYNLGNAYYRNNQLGKAILNYERALRIDVGDEDAKSNLEFAQSKIVDKIPQDEIPFYKEWANSFCKIFSKDTWGIVGVVTFIIMLIMLFVYLFKRNMRRISLVIVLITLSMTILSNISAYHLDKGTDDMPKGVILDEMVVVKSSPDSSGTELTKIHEGLTVTIIDDTLTEWMKIEANNGNRVIGWIRTKSIERI